MFTANAYASSNMPSITLDSSLADDGDYFFEVDGPEIMSRIMDLVQKYNPSFFQVNIDDGTPVNEPQRLYRRVYVGNGELVVMTIENPDHPSYDEDEATEDRIITYYFDGKYCWLANGRVLVYVRNGDVHLIDLAEEDLFAQECSTVTFIQSHVDVDIEAYVFDVADEFRSDGLFGANYAIAVPDQAIIVEAGEVLGEVIEDTVPIQDVIARLFNSSDVFAANLIGAANRRMEKSRKGIL